MDWNDLGTIVAFVGEDNDAIWIVLNKLAKTLDPGGLKISVEEFPEERLHPNKQIELMKFLLLEHTNENRKLFLSTHSPYIIQNLPAENVICVQRVGMGEPEWAKLSDHPEWEKWKEQMNAGEFWQYVGDDWVIDWRKNG